MLQYISSQNLDPKSILIISTILTTFLTVICGLYLLPFSSKIEHHTTLANIPDFVTASIPTFVVLMIIEAVLIKKAKITAQGAQYEFIDTWGSIVAGVLSLIVGIIAKPYIPVTFIYGWIWDNYRLTELFGDAPWLSYIGSFVLADFSYYWFHRHTHQFNIMWIGHSTHHNSDHYNLSVALRQSWWDIIYGKLWGLPIALLSPPRVYILCDQWVLIYQFWIHTCVIRRLHPFIEYIFSTPSHHRVHHDRRLHKNFGGVFIIWDRLFGTFQDEQVDYIGTPEKNEESCYFGIRDQTETHTEPVFQMVILKKVCKRIKENPTIKTIKNALLVGPGYLTVKMKRPISAFHPDLIRVRPDTNKINKYIKYYVGIRFLWILMLFLQMMINISSLLHRDILHRSVFLIFSLISQGLLLNHNYFSIITEIVTFLIPIK